MFFIHRNILIFFSFLLIPSFALAWNEDYAHLNMPPQRKACISSNESVLFQVRSIVADETCSESEKLYTVIIGRKPQGSLALIPFQLPFPYLLSSKKNLEPNASPYSPLFWSFTCLISTPLEVLGVPTKEWRYLGEIVTSAKNQSCFAAYGTAQGLCLKEFGGNDLWEKCE